MSRVTSQPSNQQVPPSRPSNDDSPILDRQPLDLSALEEPPPVADKSTAEDRIAEQLGGLRNEIGESRVLSSLVTDPLFREVLNARQAGRKARVVYDDETQPVTTTVDENVDFEALDNKGIVQHVTKSLPNIVREAVKASLQPIMDEMAVVKSSVTKGEADKATAEIAKAKAKFPDFDTFRPAMVTLNQQNPGLSVEELYLTARFRQTGSFGPDRTTASERPTHSTARPSLRQERRAPLPPGRTGFNQVMQEALSRLDLDSLSNE